MVVIVRMVASDSTVAPDTIGPLALHEQKSIEEIINTNSLSATLEKCIDIL
jgi:hypothetical protein